MRELIRVLHPVKYQMLRRSKENTKLVCGFKDAPTLWHMLAIISSRLMSIRVQ